MRPRLEDRPARRRLPVIVALGVMALLAVPGCEDGGADNRGAEPQPGGPAASPSAPANPSTPASPSAPGSPSAPVTPRPGTTASKPPAAGTWRMLPAAPVSGGTYLAHVWTGTELIIHNVVRDTSERPRVVDAAYNPTTNRWRKLPANPYPVRNTEGGVRAVWTGTEMLTFGQSYAAYNPRTNRWRPIAPGPAGPSVTVWTGRQVLMWGGGCCGGEESAAGWAYDPWSNAWRKLPAAPLSGRHATGVWTGWEMVVVGGTRHGVELTDAAAYNPATRTWRKIASLPAPRLQATLTWTGTEVLMVGGGAWSQWTWRPYQDGLGYNPYTNRWRRLPNLEQARSQHMAVWTGRQLLVWGGVPVPFNNREGLAGGAAYTPATNRWSALPKAPLRGRCGAVAAWIGREMLVWGGTSAGTAFSDGAIYRP